MALRGRQKLAPPPLINQAPPTAGHRLHPLDSPTSWSVRLLPPAPPPEGPSSPSAVPVPGTAVMAMPWAALPAGIWCASGLCRGTGGYQGPCRWLRRVAPPVTCTRATSLSLLLPRAGLASHAPDTSVPGPGTLPGLAAGTAATCSPQPAAWQAQQSSALAGPGHALRQEPAKHRCHPRRTRARGCASTAEPAARPPLPSMSMMASTALVMASPLSFSAMQVYTPASSFLLSRIQRVPYSSPRGASSSSFRYQRRLGRGLPTATTRSRMSQPVPIAAFFSFRAKNGAAGRAGPSSGAPGSAVTLARFGGMPGLGGAARGSPPALLVPPRPCARCMVCSSPTPARDPRCPEPAAPCPSSPPACSLGVLGACQGCRGRGGPPVQVPSGSVPPPRRPQPRRSQRRGQARGYF